PLRHNPLLLVRIAGTRPVPSLALVQDVRQPLHEGRGICEHQRLWLDIRNRLVLLARLLCVADTHGESVCGSADVDVLALLPGRLAMRPLDLVCAECALHCCSCVCELVNG